MSGDDEGARRLRQTRERLLADEVLGSLRHDLLNRLTGFGAMTFQLRRHLERGTGSPIDESSAELFAGLSRQLTQATELIDRRLLPPPDRGAARCRLAPFVTGVVAALADDRVRFAAPSSSPSAGSEGAVIDESELRVALLCLIDNALDAVTEAGAGGSVVVDCAARDGGLVAIAVVDGGTGVAAAVADQAAGRFFTTKHGHLGLGLNIAATVARRWGGRVELHNRNDGVLGAEAVLVLPMATAGG